MVSHENGLDDRTHSSWEAEPQCWSSLVRVRICRLTGKGVKHTGIELMRIPQAGLLVQVFSDGRQVNNGLDAELFENRGVSDSTELKDLRGTKDTTTQDDDVCIL